MNNIDLEIARPRPFYLKVLAMLLAFAAVLWWAYESRFKYSPFRDAVSTLMKDPSSTTFMEEHISEDHIYCARMNGKNSYGAYAGVERVMTDGRCYVELETGEYVGLSDARKTETCNVLVNKSLLELDVENARLDARVVELKRIWDTNVGGEKTYSKEKGLEEARKVVFEKRWQERCSNQVQHK